MERDFQKDIRINEEDLEQEWIEHPSLVLYYNELWAAAIYERDRCKIELEYIFARLDSEIRKNWEKFFESKPTEAAIKNYIILKPEYREAEKRLLNASRKANLMSGVKNSFEHRKAALQNIVSLRISGFHSEPRNIKRDMERKIEGREKRTIRKKLIQKGKKG